MSHTMRAYSELLAEAQIPINAHLDITYRCDLDCEHCYLDDKDGWPELPTKAWLGVLDELAAWGTMRLVWSGGEVFARPDFMALLEHAGRLGFASVVKTHAGNVDAALAGALAAVGVFKVDVSVYSLSPAVHDAVTRVPGSLDKTLAGIAALRTAGLRVKVSVSVFRSNLAEVEAMDDFFNALGCEVNFSAELKPDNAGGAAVLALALEGDDLVRFERQRLRLARKHHQASPDLAPLDRGGRPCGVAIKTIYIAPDGALQPCVVFPRTFGHLREGSIRQQWETSAFRRELAAWGNADRDACGNCGGAGKCDYCAATAFKLKGDYREAPPQFHADTRARLRAYELERGTALGEDVWSSVPLGEPEPQRARKAVFPIYRPRKGAAAAPERSA
jgi:radical SAM protein with 4Fe4S-binding SPASM domain